MLVEKITSRQNPLVKKFRRVRTGAEPHLALLEGVRLVEEALDSGAHFESVAFSQDLGSTARGLELKHALERVSCRGAELSKQVMDYISDTESPQGIAALIVRPTFTLEDVLGRVPQLVVIADGLQDPGNIGAIIRTAEAAGATGMLTTPGSVSPYNPKALRASMGSALRLPVAVSQKPDAIAEACASAGVAMFAASPTGSESFSPNQSVLYTDTDFRPGVAVIIGSEGGGISSKTLIERSQSVHIPMAPSVDSLNVASSTAILLYEAARQRGFKLT